MKDGTFVRALKDDVSGRWRAGEIGVTMENHFDKYNHFVDFGTQYMELFGKVILAKRHYYFYAGEVEAV